MGNSTQRDERHNLTRYHSSS